MRFQALRDRKDNAELEADFSKSLGAVLDTPEGDTVIKVLLAKCGIYNEMNPKGDLNYQAGARNIGTFIIRNIP